MGSAVPKAANNPEFVSDCEALLAHATSLPARERSMDADCAGLLGTRFSYTWMALSLNSIIS